MSYSSGQNANATKTALDDVFYQEFNGKTHPNYVTAENPQVFNQLTADSAAVIWEEFMGVGYWEEKKEEQGVPQGTPRIGNQKTFNIVDYDKSVDIPKRFYDDGKHDVINKMTRNFGRRAMTTRDKNAFAPFRNGFATELCADGVAWFSNSHTAMAGDTVDNLITGTFSSTNLATMLQMLLEQKAQDGAIDGHVGQTIVIPPALWKTATETLDSTLEAGVVEHQINVYSAKYGLYLATNAFLGAAAGGSDAAYFILSANHSLNRWTRKAVQTALVPWEYQRNNNYIYKGEYRETVGVMTYEGSIASNGTV